MPSTKLALWNFGNTTLRNPNRIVRGLRLFANEFQGRVHGESEESEFARRLVEEGIVDSEGSYSSLLGRKWRSSFVKLGFATSSKYGKSKSRFSSERLTREKPMLYLTGIEYEITSAGKHLLQAEMQGTNAAVEDVFLRQLVRLEIPSPIETKFSGGRMKPFIFLLQILRELQIRGELGLNKFEIAAFLQAFADHTPHLVDRTVQSIMNYRQQLKNARPGMDRKKLDRRVLDALSKKTGIKVDTPIDYADTTSRYSMLTGLVAWSGSRLVIRESKLALVDAIVAVEPNFLADVAPLNYLADFYTGTLLPFDNSAFALTEINRLVEQLTQYAQPIPEIVQRATPYSPIPDLESTRYQLSAQLDLVRENQFAIQQSQPSAIKDTLRYLQLLENTRQAKEEGVLDPPAYLEWAVWRAFLAIDQIRIPIQGTRRFPLDQELFPRDHAPGNGADMLFEFDDYILVVEVTLTTSLRQLVAEGEPVRRHIADIAEKTSKPVYGLFLAPQIDNNTAHIFASGVWYSETKQIPVNVIPLTLSQFRDLISIYPSHPYLPRDLQRLLDDCIASRNPDDPIAWRQAIATQTTDWLALCTPNA